MSAPAAWESGLGEAEEPAFRLARLGHEVEQASGQLGKVNFANTCDAKVQHELQRGFAMLHSFWYTAGDKTFRHVLADDPGCAEACSTSWPQTGQAVAVVKAAAAANEVMRMTFSWVIGERCARLRACSLGP